MDVNETRLPEIRAAVAALPALPADAPGDRYGVQALTAAWLADFTSDHTKRAYFGDLMQYLEWCRLDDLDPLKALGPDVVKFKAQLVGSDSSKHRRLSSVSSWYRYLLRQRAVAVNPLDSVRRPKVNRDASTSVGLTVDEVKAMIRVAEQRVREAAGKSQRALLVALRNRVVIRVLSDLALRRAEVCSLDVDSLGHNRGYRTVRFSAKGGTVRERPMAGPLVHAVEEYLAVRGSAPGPLLVSIRPGGHYHRLDPTTVFRIVRSLAAEAKIPSVDRLGPHALRHAFVTNAREMGVALEDVQDAVGHADPRTTRRYDRARKAMHRDPGLRLGVLYTDEED